MTGEAYRLRDTGSTSPARAIALHCRAGGNHPVSAAVWTVENGEKGLGAALSNQDAWGGHVFVSTSSPGYVVWFDLTYTPSMVLAHELTRGHTGVLNPNADQRAEYQLALFAERVAGPVASETQLPQAVYVDQDGYLNHTCFGARHLGTAVFCVLPERYFD